MSASGYVELSREVVATQIPSGNPFHLSKGTRVEITQALGGSFTVRVIGVGGLYRISGPDGDALGLEPLDPIALTEGPYEELKVWEQLKNCYDPEIPVNIVDLGLIYSLEAFDDEEAGGKRISVKMTLTAPGCGMGPSIAADAERRMMTVPGVSSARVEVVWDPPWSPDRISAEGRERLGME